MSQLYQDSMAIAHEYGPATYFITVTASPHWEELQAALLPGQEPSDHPDLVVRVFHRKLTLLLKHLKSVFGKQMSLSTKNRVYLILIFYFGSKMSTNHTQLNKWTRYVHFLTQSYSIALTLIGNMLYVLRFLIQRNTQGFMHW